MITGNHNIYTHFSKDRNCEICHRTKITRALCRRGIGGVVPRAENFGDLITAGHKILSDGSESRNNHRFAIVVQDSATQWIQSFQYKTKTSQETERSLQKFLEPSLKPKVIYTDNSLRLSKACADLSWNHCTSTLHRSENKGIAERAVRRIEEGTSAMLLQSATGENWWADSMECYCYLRNIQDRMSDGKIPYEGRFGEPLKGSIVPFGSLVEYHPGSVLYARGIWKGDILVVDLEELEEMDASEIHATRLNTKEVVLPKSGENCKFPVADGKVLPCGGDQGVRTSTLILNQPVRGESRHDFLNESKGSPPTTCFRESYPDAGEARDDFWSISGDFIYRHHVEPRVKLYTPRRESFPIPLKYIDVTRVTHTTLDVLQDSRIHDYWNIDGARDLSDSLTAFTQFSLQKGTCGPGGDSRSATRPDHLRPEIWRIMSRNAKMKEKQNWASERPKLENARKLRGICFIESQDKEFAEIIKNARKKLEIPTAPAKKKKTKKRNRVTCVQKDDHTSKVTCIPEAD